MLLKFLENCIIKTHDFMMRDKLRGNGEKLKDGFVRVAALTPKNQSGRL